LSRRLARLTMHVFPFPRHAAATVPPPGKAAGVGIASSSGAVCAAAAHVLPCSASALCQSAGGCCPGGNCVPPGWPPAGAWADQQATLHAHAAPARVSRAPQSNCPPKFDAPPSAAVDTHDAFDLDEDLVAMLAGLASREPRARPRRARGSQPVAPRAHSSRWLSPQVDAATHEVRAARCAAAERKQELYGARTSEVRALEAQLNRAFDGAVRTHRPPVWPSAPLRLFDPSPARRHAS
jgi:hypothetical protein